jgi:3-keto-5-aminohexanoate cleavage enzyme
MTEAYTTKFALNFTPTGMIPTKDINAHTPIQPDEIIQEVLEARSFGISMVHLHARDTDGKPTWKKETYKAIIDGIRSVDGYGPDSLILCVSTSGRDWPDFERRSECLDLVGDSKPDMASLTLGSMNFAKSASINSPEMIQSLLAKMNEKGIKPELEIFDTGMLNYAHYLKGKGMLKGSQYFNIITGNIATAQTKALEIGTMISQLPKDAIWASGGLGASQLKANVFGLINGGGVRIGLEDNIYMNAPKKTLATNQALLTRIKDIASLLDITPYTPKELRKLLNL